ncbi:antitoxin Xre/MbcA/ParS toxin-binding domain-containing protein [Cellvibrio fibrivorans]|jgi:putative toxin-antitoxin system antitoxin component (TIGR02293 family)|uniref:Toxin-antitoxin system antitoxin component (TIGR02293 family) n=1 Tax=Cellvibrio fibrivorans TaxID=126350 RepID=A0ABU1UUW9_9GAMM|nr:antitoxin Xre/MbcA/ParS toxin-binding domain-containing protein [Cellvibrio fibrivorans]MDR7088927.1 putative toxin-antitoxin system antitoxin component (TIGR02293 family) [Cellvibrio fibrivorans]
MQHSEFTPEKANKGVSARVMARVGSILHIGLKTPLDVVRVSREGIVTSAVDLLVDQGFNRRDLDWIIPLRTLTHRREKGQKLTTDETERWLRAAKISALAQEVLGADKAMAWLNKPRKVFDGLSAMELIKTEPGASLVEETLIQLDEGYF